MNAINFIKQYGTNKAREVVAAYHGIQYYTFKEKTERGYSACRSVDLDDLKLLVNSVDLIKKHGGLFSTKCQLDKGGSHYEWYGDNGDYGLTDLEDLEQAVADYESIYGDSK